MAVQFSVVLGTCNIRCFAGPPAKSRRPTLLNFLLGRKQILDAWQNLIKLRAGLCVDIVLEDILVLVLLGFMSCKYKSKA